MPGVETLEILKNLVNSKINQRELNLLIEKAYRISTAYLRSIYPRIYKITLNENIELEDVAIDAIAPLFIKNQDGQFGFLIKAFNSWKPEIKTEAAAAYFLNKIVAKRVEQHIASLLKESDPFFAKIFDSINYIIKRDNFKKINYLGKSFIVKLDCDEIDCEVIGIEEFEKLPLDLFLDQKSLLNKLIDYLEINTEYYPAVPVNLLVHKLKVLNAEVYIIKDSVENTAVKLEVDEVVNFGLKNAKEKLSGFYLRKNKLNPAEAKMLNDALADMAEDLKDGGLNPGLYDYLKTYKNNLTREFYQNNYHNILEYLLKVMRNTIAENLQNW